MADKIILGFVGQIASGKGTAVEYLKTTFGASSYRFSGMLKDILKRLYLDLSRENYQTLSQALRENFGEDILARVMAEDVKNDTHDIIAIDGVRRPGDVSQLTKIPGFVLIHITADIGKRYERITQREEKVDDKTKTFEEFRTDHMREAEIKIEEIAAHAHETVDNNGTIEELYIQLDALVQRYTKNN